MTPGETSPSRYPGALHVMAAVVFLAPPVAIFSPKAMAPLFLIAAAALIAGALPPGRLTGALRAVPRYLWAGAGALVLWGAASAAWSVDGLASLRLAASLLALFGLGLAAVALTRLRPFAGDRRLGTALLAGLVLALALFAVEGLSGNWLTKLAHGLEAAQIQRSGETVTVYVHPGDDPLGEAVNVAAYLKNGVDVLVLFLWPGLLVLARRRRWPWAAALAGGSLWAVLGYGGSGALVALVAGAVLAGLAAWRARLAGAVLAAGFVAVMVLAPVVAEAVLVPADLDGVALRLAERGIGNSVAARLFTWRFVAGKVLERPAAGWGLDASRAIPGGSDKYTVLYRPPARPLILFSESYLPLHPHNLALQVWLELGAVGALVFAAAGGALLWRLGRPGGGLPGVARCGLAAAILTPAMVSFGTWQSWWISVVFLVAVVLAAVSTDEAASGPA